jgi:hypothetical protein
VNNRENTVCCAVCVLYAGQMREGVSQSEEMCFLSSKVRKPEKEQVFDIVNVKSIKKNRAKKEKSY